MRRGFLVCCALFVVACGARPAGVQAPAASAASVEPAALDYDFAIDGALRVVSVRMCPSGALPARLVAGMREARGLLQSVAIERGAQRVALAADEQGVPLTGLREGDCVRYELDMDAAHSGLGAPMARHVGASLMTNIAALLWRPLDHDRYREAHARFELPEGAQLSVPWPKLADGRYALDHTAFAFHAYAAFGKLAIRELQIAGSSLELAMLDGLSNAQQAAIERWVNVQAGAVATLNGKLPRARIQLVVLPTGPSREPMRFGSMTRGGGASVGLLIASDFDEAKLMQDWVLIHELSHLLHPFVERDEAWLSEGIATYYQEVLRARAGLQSPETAWKRILNGSRQGESMQGNLERGAAEMYSTYRFAPVYWGGAAIMLLADVELRRQSNGERALDDALMELSSCCSVCTRPWASTEVADRIDRFARSSVMRDLIADVVRGARFPTLAALYAQLGLDEEGRPTGDAPLSAVRDAIMRPRPSLRPEGLGGTSAGP